MLDPRLFADRKAAADSLCRDIHTAARRRGRIHSQGDLKTVDRRELVFLDTVNQTIFLNRFVFRERREIEPNHTEYTLKCRSPGRYVAAGADVSAREGKNVNEKFEEDIGAPFVARFSHSNTVTGRQRPETLKEAAKLFPALGRVVRDGEQCSQNVQILPVNYMQVFERVLKGLTWKFQKTTAELALIFWSDGEEGRPLAAELSFRYRDDKESFSAPVADQAMDFFLALQRMDWCLPASRTKTQFIYGE